MATQKFINAWDNIIDDWMNIPCVSDPSNPFNPLQVHPSLSVEHLPEPYFGDPADCSIVMINLNPGEGGPIQHWSMQNNSGIVGSAKTNIVAWLYLSLSPPIREHSMAQRQINGGQEDVNILRNCWE